MPLTLDVDGDRWRTRIESTVTSSSVPIVPVAKGNGYGFGNTALATEAAKLDVATMAVGEYEELADVAAAFRGDLLVLSPWRPWIDVSNDVSDRVIHTVSRLDDLRALGSSGARPRVVVELLTSMRRHGVARQDFEAVAALLDDVQWEGFALHLPLTGDHRDEARTLAGNALAAATPAGKTPTPIWLSHISAASAAPIAAELGTEARLRVGTSLWLGDRSQLTARSTVLDAHQVHRGDRYGYRQRKAQRTGTILVVAGGTAHGIGLEAPTPAASMRQRAVSLAKGGLEAAGRSLSPFRVSGKQCWFAEPPHMQCSMIWLPSGAPAPAVGDELDVDVRFTTTQFDEVRFAPKP
jgi:alanine racemase